MPATELHITHDGPLDVATGRSRKEVKWKNKETTWAKIVEKLSKPHHTAETYAVYCTSKKDRQAEIKDVGGFVGGYLNAGRRKAGNVVHRQLITLDIDSGSKDFWQDFTLMYGCAACIYSTHKHSPEKPRLRLIIPLDRPVLADEYEPIGRRIAGDLGIDYFDPTTFEPSRLMHWQSTSSDAEYLFEYQDGEWLCADTLLDSYHDWKDSSEWPTSEKYETDFVKSEMKSQEDPHEKPGLIGAFCRTYSVAEVFEKFLSDDYEACDLENRYTYKHGSTTAGLIVYDDKWVYSHHGTDPLSGKLSNAFDAVRRAKFGLKDTDVREGTKGNRLPSYVAMEDLVRKDKAVIKALGEQRLQSAFEDFADGTETETLAEIDTEWASKMEVDGKGNPLSTFHNLTLIFRNDPFLKNLIGYDEFDKSEIYLKKPQHRKLSHATRRITDADEVCIWAYLESVYNISVIAKIRASLLQITRENSFHPIKQYLDGLVWDGEERVNSLLQDYMGVVDSEYTSATMRKMLVAAVTRIYNPGAKFDYVLVLVGAQGLKKSMLIDKLGQPWYSDSLYTMEAKKEAFEQLQGVWLAEIAELSAMNKGGIESVKHFITKREDRYRVAFGKRTENFGRQCVFFATTNTLNFLKDPTGNRRFWPCLVHTTTPLKDVAKDLTESERDQIWAEVIELYKKGEPLYLSKELEAYAQSIQTEHTEDDDRVGLITKYLDTLLPDNWEEMDIFQRRGYLSGGDELQAVGANIRTRVCAAEIFCEVLDGKKSDLSKWKTKDIHDILLNLKGWKRTTGGYHYELYGRQMSYNRTYTSEKLKAELREKAEN